MYRFTAALALAALSAPAQPAPPSSAALLQALKLAETGHCREALPQLSKAPGHVTAPDLKRRVGSAGVRCAMDLNDATQAVSFLLWLNREFPHDPAILYLSSHVYSDLSLRASNELLTTAPGSPQVHELNAEALETMGKWKDAADEYRAVLAKDPAMPGIHYRLGRLLLSEPDPASPTGDASQKNKQAAKIEFQEELKIDPNNAGAEFVLGELARQDEQWPEAIAHFRKATQLNAGFADAYIGLGRALVGANRAQEAIAPLETAVKLQPGNPAAHFQLATAYLHTGRKQDADREFLAQKQAADRTQQMKDEIKRQVSGDANQKPVH